MGNIWAMNVELALSISSALRVPLRSQLVQVSYTRMTRLVKAVNLLAVYFGLSVDSS